MTNYERIKAMTVNEMAEMFEEIFSYFKSCGHCIAFGICMDAGNCGCEVTAKKWLESEVHEDESKK
jgi:hypothetical protein